MQTEPGSDSPGAPAAPAEESLEASPSSGCQARTAAMGPGLGFPVRPVHGWAMRGRSDRSSLPQDTPPCCHSALGPRKAWLCPGRPPPGRTVRALGLGECSRPGAPHSVRPGVQQPLAARAVSAGRQSSSGHTKNLSFRDVPITLGQHSGSHKQTPSTHKHDSSQAFLQPESSLMLTCVCPKTRLNPLMCGVGLAARL